MANRVTRVRLLNVPLENDYKQTIFFRDRDYQKQYFEQEATNVREYTDFNYIRKDNKIRVPEFIDNIGSANYLFYDNVTGDGRTEKRFYCFITKMEYVDDNRTDIFIETDVMQTYLNEYTIRDSFIEREHVDYENDKIGQHTIPEQLELGEYTCFSKTDYANLRSVGIVMATTVNLNGEDFPNVAGGYYNGIYSGVKYYWMSKATANNAIKALADAGKSDAIVSIFHVPSFTVEFDETQTYYEIKQSDEAHEERWSLMLQPPETIDGYTPKNNKLFTYPYRYLLLNNNAGGSAIYHYEKFNGSVCFDVYSCLTVGMSICFLPVNYNGVADNDVNMICAGKFPVCSWNTDVYTNWLTQNSINIGTSLASSGLQVVGGVGAMLGGLFTGGLTSVAGAGAMVNGFTGIANTMGEVYAHSLQPPQAEGSINNGDSVFASGKLTMKAYHMCIKKEYAKIIDLYFQMYGYKVNRIGVPLKNHRSWWFTKTIGINIDSDSVRVEDLQKIKRIYDNGITFMRYPRLSIDYSENNSYVIDET